MSGHHLAVVALAAAPLLPLATVVEAPTAAANDRVVTSTHTHKRPTSHQMHVRHRHHVHVLHVQHLRNQRQHGASRSTVRSSVRARIITAAERYKGQPYSYGNLDCSGLTQRAYRTVGISLPRSAADQWRHARRIGSPRPGDLVFYGAPAYHVAIYVRKGWMIVARHTGTVIQEQQIYGSPSYGTVL